MVKMYHLKDGEVEMTETNAEEALRHPNEWARTRWPDADEKPAPAPVDPNLPRAAHRGGGSWAVMRGDEVVESGLAKDEAEAKVFEMLKASDEVGANAAA
jgi:hypothetical protein